MQQWSYYCLLVSNPRKDNPRKDVDGKWLVTCYNDDGGAANAPLNPRRDWAATSVRSDSIAWDDAGYLDMADEVVAKLGLDGWELVGIDGWTAPPKSSRYIFKKPLTG